MGYIEVQQSEDKVEEKLRVADENLKVAILDEDGEILPEERSSRRLPRPISLTEVTGSGIWLPGFRMKTPESSFWHIRRMP